MPTVQAALPIAARESSLSTGTVYFGRIVAVAAVLRLLVVWRVAVRNPPDWLFHRGIELGILAGNLRAGRGFSSPFGGSTGPTALLAPGYPAMVAAVFRIFGSFTFASEIAVMLIQTVFCSLTVIALMDIAHRAFGVRTANLAGTIWAVGIPLLWMPTISWETSLSALLLTTVAALSLRCASRPSAGLWLLLGAMSGGALLINPALLLAMVAAMGWAAYQQRSNPTTRYTPALAVVLMLLIVSPWIVRNERILHAFIPVRSSFGYELWNGNQDGATGVVEDALNPAFNKQQFAVYSRLGEMPFMHEKTALAEQWIRTHPGKFASFTARRVWLFWSGTGHRTGERTSGLVVLYLGFTTVCGLAGFMLLGRKRLGMTVFFALPLLLFPLPYCLTHADVRYRLVIDPLLTVLTAYALAKLFINRADRSNEPAT